MSFVTENLLAKNKIHRQHGGKTERSAMETRVEVRAGVRWETRKIYLRKKVIFLNVRMGIITLRHVNPAQFEGRDQEDFNNSQESSTVLIIVPSAIYLCNNINNEPVKTISHCEIFN